MKYVFNDFFFYFEQNRQNIFIFDFELKHSIFTEIARKLQISFWLTNDFQLRHSISVFGQTPHFGDKPTDNFKYQGPSHLLIAVEDKTLLTP